MVDYVAIKKRNEDHIRGQGGKICDWLPHIEETTVRPRDEIVGRSLVLLAILQIPFGAPIPFIRDWITRQGADAHLSKRERLILAKPNNNLTDQEKIDLGWYIECLWAFMWANSLADSLELKEPVPNYMASLTPDLQKNEDGSKFTTKMALRNYEELYGMRDLYYRAHWQTEDCRLKNLDPKGFNGGIIMERRRVLEWIMDPGADWDNVDLST
jgi:uncharacterized protein DUF4272